MIVASTQRSGSTIYCAQLAEKLGLKFGNQVIDGQWKGYSGPKANWHEYKGGEEAESFFDVIEFYRKKDEYVILDHSSHPFILDQADQFVSRRNVMASTSSIVQLIEKRANGRVQVPITLEMHLQRTFDFFQYCQKNEKKIIWLDDTYEFTVKECRDEVREQIGAYIRQRRLHPIIDYYKLKV